jgi:hypothetical protein
VASGPAPASGDGPLEVVVRGKKTKPDPVGGTTLRGQSSRAIPGTFGDAFQALASMPGVAPMASGLPFFYVRGAPPADTGYFIDGVPVPTVFHIGPGASILPEGLIDRIDFYPGAAPARYGRFVGGIIAAETTSPRGAVHGEGSVRLFDASAFVESPLGEDTDVAAGGRYGYPNLLLSIFAPKLSLSYGDYSVRVGRKLSPHDRISVFALGAFDHEEDASQSLVPVDSQFHRIDLRYDHTWSSGSLRVATTYGYERTSGDVPSSFAEMVDSRSARLRFELLQRFGDAAELSAGADATTSHYGFGYLASSSSASPVGNEEAFGAYADLTLHLFRGVDLVPSARVDEYRPSTDLRQHDQFAFDPKLAARIALTSRVTWLSTLGVAHQEPSYVVPIPGVRVSSPNAGLQKVTSFGEGFEARLPGDLKARATAFYQADHDVSDYVSACGSLLDCSSVASVDGRTYGLEVLVQRPLTRRLGGWLSYTLSRAERTVSGLQYLSPFDRTHALAAVLHYDFGSGVGAGVRFTYYSGRPDTGTTDRTSPVAFSIQQIGQHRLPDFYRLDLRVDKRWELGDGHWLTGVLEFFDATLNKEAVDYKCNVGSRLCTAQEIGPIALPSIGLEGGF